MENSNNLNPTVNPTGVPQGQPMAAPLPQSPVGPAPVQPAPAAPNPLPQEPAPAVAQQSPAPQAVPVTPTPQTPAPQFQQAAPRVAPQSFQQPTNRPPVQSMPGQPGRPRPLAAVGGPNPRKFILGCLGFIAFSLLLFVIFVIAFVSQTSASGQNGLASALGVNPAEFTNTLILMTNLVFGIITIITFFVAVFGFFRTAMAAKSDKPTRSAGLKQAAIAGSVFLVMTMIWVFVYLYLNGKKVDAPAATQTQSIVTDPVITTRLIAPVDVKFDGTKIPYNPNILELTFYQWDFGDGTSSTSPSVTHTYNKVGQFDVKLVVTARNKQNNQTLTQNFNKLVTVSEVKVSASFTATPTSGPAPLSVEFDASASKSPAGQIRSYEWDFQGQTNFRDASGPKAKYTFEREGTYEVKLRVSDSSGQTSIVSQNITAGGPDLPTPVISIPTTDGKYYVGKQLTFLGEKSTSPNGEITKYEWDFGDASPKANTRTATHSYKTAGLYEVILKTTDVKNKTSQVAKKITLENEEQGPQAVIETDPALADKQKSLMGKAPFEVAFDARKSTDPDNNIVEFKWDFDGDNKEDAAGPTANFVYKIPGSYNATLTALDSAGNQSSTVLVVKVAAQDLTARLTADKIEGNAPLTVTFDASGSSYPDGQITSYEWDFGDGSPKRIDASQVSYKYTAIGTFTATVTAKSSDGKTDAQTLIINVRPISLQACFTPTVEQGPAPLTIEFDPRCSQGSVAKYLWDFGDSETSRTRKPSHTFNTAGSYQVTLEVTDNQNVVNTFSKNILVTGNVQ